MSAKRIKTRHSGIYKRGGSYVYVYRDRDGRQRSGSARTLDDAIKARRSLTARVDRGEDVVPKRVTFAEYAREWIETYGRDGSLRPGTRQAYRNQIESRLIPQIGDVELSRLRKSHVKSFLVWLCDDDAQGRHLTDATIRKIVAPLSSCLRSAVEDEVGGILSNPVSGVRLPRRDKAHAISTGTDAAGARDDEQARILTEEQAAALVAAVPDEHRELIRLLDVTGLRISEALALRWADLDLDVSPRLYVNRMVTINPDRKPDEPWWIYQPPKSLAGTRSVPIPESLAADLQRRRVELIADGTPAGDLDLAFPTRKGTPLDQKNLRRRAFAPAAKVAGVEWAGFHALRHTCASRLFASGMNPKQIAKWLGHSDAAFTLRTYVHLMPDDAPAALPESAQGGSTMATTGRYEGVPTTTATLQKAA
jgi:integrase